MQPIPKFFSAALVPAAIRRLHNGETSLVREIDAEHDAIRALIQARVTDALGLVR
jgi:hypothetical protein